MGIVQLDAIEPRLRGAQRGLRNVKRLGFGPIGDTNLAEAYVYAGDLAAAAHWNEVGRIGGAGFGPVTFNQMLMQWSAGDLDGARRAFELLRVQYPELIRTINVAPLPTAPRHFEEFAGYCCASPACGPFLEHACAGLGLPVKHREISEETVLRELRLEMEKERRLREIYRQRKELELEVEVEAESDAPPR